MTTPLNFGQLTYKQGMNTLVGPPVETFAKVSQALTERYWKVRQGVADTKNALSNLQVRESDKYIVRDAQNTLSSKFEETSKSDNWHRAQGDLIDAVGEIQSNEGLKLALASKQANIKVDEEIDKAEGWSPEEKQLRKYANESHDNQVKKDPITGTWTGGYKGVGLGKKVNVVSKIKEWSDIADKVFKASSTDITSVGQVGQQLGISDAVGNYNGKEMTFNQFVETHRSFKEEIKKEDITKFIGSLMAADSELIQSMNTENELALTKHRLQTDDTGNLIKDKETGRVILKDLDPSVVHNLIQQMPVSPYDMASRLYNSDDFALLTKDNPNGSEKAKIKELLSIYGVTKLEDIYKSELASKNYANFATMEILGTDKQTPSSEFIAQTYSALKINNTFNNLAKTLGNNMGYSKIIEESKLTENGSFGHLVSGVIARQKETSNTWLSPSISIPRNLPSDIEQTNKLAQELDVVSKDLNIAVAKRKAILSGNVDSNTFNELRLDIEGNKDKALKELDSKIKDLSDAQANIQHKSELSHMGIKDIFEKYNALSGLKLTAGDVIDNWHLASLKDEIVKGIPHSLIQFKSKDNPTQIIRQTIESSMKSGKSYTELESEINKISPGFKLTKSQIDSYNTTQNKFASRYESRLKDNGVKLQSMANLFTEQTDDPNILKQDSLILENIILNRTAGEVLSSTNPNVPKGIQLTDPSLFTTLGATYKNTRICKVFGDNPDLGLGESMYKIDILSSGTEAKKLGGDGAVTNSILVKIPTPTFAVDGLNEIINKNKAQKTNTQLAAVKDAHRLRGALNTISIPTQSTDKASILGLDTQKSWGYNAGIIQDNLKKGDVVSVNIGNTLVDIVRVSDSQFKFHVNSNGQPWIMKVQTEDGIKDVDLNTLDRSNKETLNFIHSLPDHIRAMLGDTTSDLASFTAAFDSF